MKKTYFRNWSDSGFTLIELLVVIAIIGILSSVVLASLNTARGKGANAAIKGDLNNIRAQAELFYDNQTPNSYGSFGFANCGTSPAGVFNDPNVKQALVHALSLSLDTTSGAKCVANGTAWAAEVQLKANDGVNNAWCVDSTGQSKGTTFGSIGASDLICG